MTPRVIPAQPHTSMLASRDERHGTNCRVFSVKRKYIKTAPWLHYTPYRNALWSASKAASVTSHPVHARWGGADQDDAFFICSGRQCFNGQQRKSCATRAWDQAHERGSAIPSVNRRETAVSAPYCRPRPNRARLSDDAVTFSDDVEALGVPYGLEELRLRNAWNALIHGMH